MIYLYKTIYKKNVVMAKRLRLTEEQFNTILEKTMTQGFDVQKESKQNKRKKEKK